MTIDRGALHIEMTYYYVTAEGETKAKRVPVPWSANLSDETVAWHCVNGVKTVIAALPSGCRDATKAEIDVWYQQFICDSADIIHADIKNEV